LEAIELEHLRREFPVVERWAYLDHAGIGPLPRRAARRIAAQAKRFAEGGGNAWEAADRRCREVRAAAARLMGARHAHEIAFVANTSTGLSLVAQGLEWRPGDNVVGATAEFPSNVHPWVDLAHRGVEYRQARERFGRVDFDELVALVDGRTRVLALSWVQYASGYRSDLEQLGRWCRERAVLFVVDAIQGLGALALRVEHDFVDVAGAGGQKWLLGPLGSGLLYVSDRVVHRIRPALLGWRSMRNRFDWTSFDSTLAEGAERFEPGTLDALGIDALGASIELLLELGVPLVEQRVLSLAQRAAAGMAARGLEVVSARSATEASSVVAAVHPRVDAVELQRRLQRQGIVVAARAGRLRVAPHVYNSEEEIDRLLEALPEA
jgi:cysteine desulfurase / selenocysteine lyase